MARSPYVQTVDGVEDPVRSFLEHLPEMAHETDLALDDAYSYRDFNVSGALFAWDAVRKKAAIFVRANTKRRRAAKVCAEHKVMELNAQTAFDQIIGVLVRGTTDQDKIEEVNHIRVPTLWPCPDACVPEIDGNSRTTDDTLIVTTGFGRRQADKIYQAHLFGDLRSMYVDGSWRQDGQQAQYGLGEGIPGRLALFDALVLAEATRASDQQRNPAELARMALMTSMPHIA